MNILQLKSDLESVKEEALENLREELLAEQEDVRAQAKQRWQEEEVPQMLQEQVRPKFTKEILVSVRKCFHLYLFLLPLPMLLASQETNITNTFWWLQITEKQLKNRP